MKRNSGKETFTHLFALALIAIMAIGTISCGQSKEEKMREQAQQDSLMRARQDSIKQAQEDSIALKVRNDSIMKAKEDSTKKAVFTAGMVDAYKNKLTQLSASYQSSWTGYFLFDITGDGQPELWTKSGSSMADLMLHVYTYKDSGMKEIYEEEAGHTSYSRGSNYVLAISAWPGDEEYRVEKIRNHNGRLSSTLMDPLPMSPDGWPQTKEPVIKFHSVSDLGPVNQLLK